jgi:hypothetical protein
MNRRQKQLFIILVLSLVLAMLNSYAQANFLYFRFWWFDIVMHFLGGLDVGLMSIWAYTYFVSTYCDQRKARLFLVTVLATLTIGVGWEAFESFVGIYLTEAHIVSDTLMDLCMDALGAVAAYGFFVLVEIPQKIHNTDSV